MIDSASPAASNLNPVEPDLHTTKQGNSTATPQQNQHGQKPDKDESRNREYAPDRGLGRSSGHLHLRPSHRVPSETDGPRGNVRTRIVIAGMRLADGRKRVEPTTLTLSTIDDPQLQSPNFRGVPKTAPELLKHLPRDPASGDR